MKKAFSICLVAVMLLSLLTSVLVFNAGAAAWDGKSASSSLSGEGTEAAPYLISSAADLRYLANKVNTGTTYAGVYFLQTADIDLGNYEWTPIGYKDTYTFQGNYDGAGFTVSKLKVSVINHRNGLFGSIGVTTGDLANECGVANLTVNGTVSLTSTASDSGLMVAGVVGRINYAGYVGTTQAYVKNVVSEVTVSASALGASNVGGICALANGALFENVTNKGAVTVSGGSSDIPTGGLAGRAENCTFRTCVNSGAVKFTTAQKQDQSRVGGIVGYYCKTNKNQTLTFENCVNTTSVYAENTNSSPTNLLVGGILGGVYYTASTSTWTGTTTEWRNYQITFRNCANTGTISGYTPSNTNAPSVGGILGSTHLGVHGADNNGGGIKLYGCASTGTINCTNAGRSSGMIGCVYTNGSQNFDILIKDCSSSVGLYGVNKVQDINAVTLGSVANSPDRAAARAKAILSTATGDNDTVIIVVVAIVALVAICGIATKVIVKKAR